MPPPVISIRRRRSFASAYLRSSLGLLSSCLFLGTLFSGHLYYHYQTIAKERYDAIPLPFPPAGINYQAFSAEIEASPALRGRHNKVRQHQQQRGGDLNIKSKALTTGAVSYSTTSIDASTPAGRGGGGIINKKQKQKKQYLAFVPLMGLKTSDRGSLEVERLTFTAWESLTRYTASLEEKQKHAKAGGANSEGEGGGGVELHVVGLVEDSAHCDPAIFGRPFASNESGNEKKDAISCVALDPACRSSQEQFNGIPTVDCILSTAHALGEEMGADVYIMANGDVVFTPTLIGALEFAYKSFGAASPGGFAMVGRRIDLNVTMPEKPDDDPLTEESLLKEFTKARLHPATGIDYFAFTSNVFPRAFPPYLIGRWKWDNALMVAFLLGGVATIDASDVVHALHLGMKSYKAKEHMARTGADFNEALAEATIGKGSVVGRIDFTEYRMVEDLTVRNVSVNITTWERKEEGREEQEEEQEQEREQQQPHKRKEHVLALERRVHPLVEGQIAALRMVAGSAAAAATTTTTTTQHTNKKKETDAILLLPVRVGEKALALEWACWARQANVNKYMLLVADQNEALELHAELLLMEEKAKAPVGVGVVIYMDPRSIQIRNGGGRSKQYYEHKKTGQASPPVLAFMVASMVSRLLQLDLCVVMVPVLMASPPWEEEAARVLMSRLKMGSVDATAASAITTEEKEIEQEKEGEGKEKTNANATTTCHLALWRDTDEKKKQEREGNLYLRIRPSTATREEWSKATLTCFEDDARHDSVKGMMDHSRCLPIPSLACRAAFEDEQEQEQQLAVVSSHTGAPEPIVSRNEDGRSWWWNRSTGQCLQGGLTMNAPPPGEARMEGIAVARERQLGEKEI